MRNPNSFIGAALFMTVLVVGGSSTALADQPKGITTSVGPAKVAQNNIGGTTPTFTMPGTQPSVDNRVFNAGLIITTTESLEGYRIKEYRGIVRGSMVREPTAVQNFKAGFQGMFGGKVHAYITMCEQGRQQAYDAMVQKAQALGANAVVGMRYDSDAFSGGNNDFGTEVVCYGTAVVIEPKAP